jgi:hypothetical protein
MNLLVYSNWSQMSDLQNRWSRLLLGFLLVKANWNTPCSPHH